MIREFVFRVFYKLYIETIDFIMSLRHLPPRNPITDLSQATAVETYLDVLMLSIQYADEPLKLLTKSRVTCVRMAKEVGRFAQHEYTLAEVCMESGTYYFRIERTRGAQPRQTIEELKTSDDPELAEIGNTIGGLGASPSEATSPSPVSTAEPASSETLPPVLNAEPPFVSYPTKLESFSAKTVASLNTSKSTWGKPLHPADSLISRVPSLDPPSPDVTLHDIHPDNLTWLQYMLIVNLVRSEDKLYSVFGSQCYLYAHLIFLLTQTKFCPGDSKKGTYSVPVHISRRLSYPDPEQRYIKLNKLKDGMAPGTWMSVQVTQVDIVLLDRLQSKFDSRWNDTQQNIERWAEKAAKFQSFVTKEELDKARAEKKQSQASNGGPSSNSQFLPRDSGRRGMSTLPLAGLGSHTGAWTGPPLRFNSLRAPPPPANQKMFLGHLGHLFKRK